MATKAENIKDIVDGYIGSIGGVEAAGVFTDQGLEVYVNAQNRTEFAAYLATLFGATKIAVAHLESGKATMSITECDGTGQENSKYCVIVPVTESVFFGSLVGNNMGLYIHESKIAAGKIGAILNG